VGAMAVTGAAALVGGWYCCLRSSGEDPAGAVTGLFQSGLLSSARRTLGRPAPWPAASLGFLFTFH
jgi:hypothetical protein